MRRAVAALIAVALPAGGGLVSAAAQAADPNATFASYRTIFARAHSYRAVATVDNGGRTTTIHVEAIQPDRYHVILPGGAEGVIRGTTFSMKAGGRWMTVPGAPAASLGIGHWGLEPGTASPSGVTYVGRSTASGVPVERFRFVPAGGGTCTTSFALADHLPRTMDCTVGAASTHVVYSDYGADFSFGGP